MNSHTHRNTTITKITNPLDNILQTVNDLIKSNHTGRSGSSLDCAFQTIIDNVNTVKNNIISHLFNISHQLYTQHTEKQDAKESFAAVTQHKKTSNKLIIPISKTTPSHTEIRQTEERLATVIQNSNTDATIVNTKATDRGNIVFDFEKITTLIS